jgi:hypothetical protein
MNERAAISFRVQRSAVRRPTGGGQESPGPSMIEQVATPTIRVPDSLVELDQFIVWRYEQRDGGKPTKVPYQVNGSRASSTDPKTWCSFDEAVKTWQHDSPTRWSGIGFVFAATDPFFGIDLDHCLDADGRLKPWAQPIMERFSDSYAEISPSLNFHGKAGANVRLPRTPNHGRARHRTR